MNTHKRLPADNGDYHVVIDGVKLVANVPGITCEVGVRAGGGSQYIMETLAETNQKKTHIGIDPYGNIPTEGRNNGFTRYDYTNKMRNDCMIELYQLSTELSINFLFFALEDTEFFKRYGDGVPVYQNTGKGGCCTHGSQNCVKCGEKSIETQYSFVFLDGPHATTALIEEFHFFKNRTASGAVIAFDDINFYDIGLIERDHIFNSGWELITKTKIKASYRKK